MVVERHRFCMHCVPFVLLWRNSHWRALSSDRTQQRNSTTVSVFQNDLHEWIIILTRSIWSQWHLFPRKTFPVGSFEKVQLTWTRLGKKKRLASRKKAIYIIGSLIIEVKILKISKLINQEANSVFLKILWVEILKSSLHATSSNTWIPFRLFRNFAR